MTDEELLIECKTGLGFSLDTNPAIDRTIRQKMLIVKSYMINAGVPETKFTNSETSDFVIGVLVIGVTDLWELNSGVAKYSPAFITMVNQLSYPDVVS